MSCFEQNTCADLFCEGWLVSGSSCAAPESYGGACQRLQSFSKSTVLAKSNFAEDCKAPASRAFLMHLRPGEYPGTLSHPCLDDSVCVFASGRAKTNAVEGGHIRKHALWLGLIWVLVSAPIRVNLQASVLPCTISANWRLMQNKLLL